jgi:hypothetical protein
LRYQPCRWLFATARADYFRNGLAPAAGLLVSGYDLSAELAARVNGNLEIAGYYAYRRQSQEAMPAELTFNRNLVGLRLTAILAPTSRISKEVQ